MPPRPDAQGTAPGTLECHDAFLAITTRLRNLGVTITYADLPKTSAGRWEGPTATLYLPNGAQIENLVWACIEYWKLFAIGPEASAATPRGARLRSVT